MKLDRVPLCEAHDRRVRHVHARRRARPHVLHELLDVLGRDGGRRLELQDNRGVDLHVQPSDEHGHAPRHREHLHLRQARDAPVVQLRGEHALVEALGGPGLVPLDDGRARPLDRVHERGGVGGERGLQDAGPRHQEEEGEGGEI